MAGRLLPDVVVLDIGLPDIDGFDVARLLTAERARPVVVLTSNRWNADDDFLEAAVVPAPLSELAELTCYYVACEAITNAMKHVTDQMRELADRRG